MAENHSRCPTCGRQVDPSLLSYSNSADNFVCPACREGADATHASARPATPSSSTRKPAGKAVQPWMLWTAVLIVLAVCVTTACIVLTSRSSTPTDAQRSWEDANHDRIIALKSEAEGFAIEGKLAEAHAKYREMERLIGGRKMKDASLFDIIEAARGDQDRIYKMLLRAMGDTAPSPGILDRPIPPDGMPPAAGDAVDATAEAPQRSNAAYPAQYDSLRLPSTAVTSAPSETTPSSAPQEPARPALPRAEAPGLAPGAIAAAPTPAPAPATQVAAAPTTNPLTPVVLPDDATSVPTTQIGGREYPLPPQLEAVTDAAITDALLRGNSFLLSHFKNGDLMLDEPMSELDKSGVAALCTYALLQSGRAADDPRLGIKSPEMIQLLEKLKGMSLSTAGGFGLPATYARSIRAASLAVYNRPDDRDLLANDVAWLVNAATAGAYSYDDRYAPNPPPVVQRRRKPATQPAPAKKVRGVSWNGVDAPVILVDGTFTSTSTPGATYTGPTTPSPTGYPGTPGYGQRRGYPAGGYGKRVRIMIPDGPMFRNTLGNRPLPPRRREGAADANFPWDNSNSQYGVLGVWAGAELGIEVPEQYWRAVEQHWVQSQLPSGEWPYSFGWQGSFPMTTAGVATMFITHDYLDAPLLGSRGLAGVRPYNDSLTSALAWLEDGDNCVNVMQEPALDAMKKGQALFYLGYNLFGIERVGLASGFKHLGKHDWFVELLAKVLPLQTRDGAFGRSSSLRDTLIDTSFVMLFLSRGRHPVMMNKLRFEGEWTNRPRDVANLTAYASRELERQLNWQVVDIRREPDDWADSPILYIASQRKVQFSDDEIAKMMQFVDDGGIIFTQADLGSDEFNKSIHQLAKKLFPMYELMPLSTDHELYKLNYTLKMPRPRLQGVSNGVRLLMVHSPTDLAAGWQLRASVSQKDSFQLGANLYLYATGKERFRNRLDTTMVPQPTGQPQRTVKIARLRYRGNWDPEPGGWPRLARKLEWEAGVRLELSAVDADEVMPEAFSIASMTGTTAIAPGEADLAALRNFVTKGGTLIIDAAGGSSAFAEAETTWLPKLLGEAKLEPLAVDDPLLKKTVAGTLDAPPKALRLYAMTKLGAEGTRIKSATIGKGRVIYSALDISTGLLGTNTWGILGYLPEYSEAVMRNLVLVSGRSP
jgi:hypothetical protein